MKVFDILESYNTSATFEWTHHSTSKSALFNVNDEQYDIVIGYHTIHLPSRAAAFEVNEVSFGRYVDGTRTVQLTPSSAPAKVFGIVYNATLELMKHDHPEVVVFSAKTANDAGDSSALTKRLDLYHSMSLRLSQHGEYDYVGKPIKSQHAHNFLLFRHDVAVRPEEIKWIVDNA